MAKLMKCDRCKKVIEKENDISIVLGIYRILVHRGNIRPSKKLLDEVKKENSDQEYLDLYFEKKSFKEVDICVECFDDFMKLTK